MRQRIVTAIVALIVCVPVIFMGGVEFKFLVTLLALGSIIEMLMMRKILLVSPEAIISIVGIIYLVSGTDWFDKLPSNLYAMFIVWIFMILLMLRMVFSNNRFNINDAGVILLGILYIGTGFHQIIDARNFSLSMLWYLLLIIWATDTGAYFIGRQFGRTKLMPNISPNKTWEGSVGGVVIALVTAVIFYYSIGLPISLFKVVYMTIFLSVAGQLGDLIESSFKRFYSIKDSSNLLPGHGGILDRCDSLLIVFPLAHILGLF